jgi:hypothetical protein
MSQDGRLIAYIGANGSLRVMNADGSNPVALLPNLASGFGASCSTLVAHVDVDGYAFKFLDSLTGHAGSSGTVWAAASRPAAPTPAP